MASNRRRHAATIAVARGSRLGRVASAGSATMTGTSAPSPWRNTKASAKPANAPPPMTMLLWTDILDLLPRTLATQYSWAKQEGETRALGPRTAIPGRRGLEMHQVSHRDGRNFRGLCCTPRDGQIE